MLNMLKTTAVAAVVATVPFAASAATFLPNGANVTFANGDTFGAAGGVDANGGAGSWMATFTPDSSVTLPVDALAVATIEGVNFGSFTNLTIQWAYANGQAATPIALGENTLATTFSAPNALTQTLVFAWTDSVAGASFDASVSIAAVPVPAAGLMLLTALGGAAALRRRKS